MTVPHFDVAIIGGGINGSSAAQHLSAAGYSVLLVEQGDFANGATSRSSRLLHCGLRHLASGTGFWQTILQPRRLLSNLKTVRDDMLARDEIVRTMPERVRSINFCLPIYADDPFSPWQLDAAFATLRLTSPRGEPPDYRRYSPADKDKVPLLPWLRDRDQLRSVAVFREYLFDWPERVALDALFDAQRMGAIIRNYTMATALSRCDGGRWRVRLHPTVGTSPNNASMTDVTADIVLNLAGAWVDKVSTITGAGTKRKCRGLKGVHIALRLPDEFTDWGIFTFNSIGEPLYCLPSRGIHYVGLTRTPFEGEIDTVSATDHEIDWMLSEINRCLPRLGATRNDVLYTWAGINPLTHDAAQPLGSREIKMHDMESENSPGMLALTGGAIMTHRRVARRITKMVAARLPPSRQSQLPRYNVGHQQNTNSSIDGSDRPDSEILRCARDEMPATLADLLMRRLGMGWNPDQGIAKARSVAEVAAPHMGWSRCDIDREIAAYQREIATSRRKPETGVCPSEDDARSPHLHTG